MTNSDDVFHEIAERAIQSAEKVDCTLAEFYRGLRVMRAALDARLEAEAGDYAIEAHDPEERKQQDSRGDVW